MQRGDTEPNHPGDIPLTVVIPLFNGAATIAETLDSIARQTLPGVEVLVVDDGSADDGASRAGAHSVGATVLEQAHQGVAVARNRGLAAARGRWVAFLDQDDLWHPDHAQATVTWLEQHPGERIAFVGEVPFSLRSEVERLQSMDPLAGGWARHLVSEDTALDDLLAIAEPVAVDSIRHHDVRALLRGPVSMTTSFIADPELLRLAGGFAPHALAMDDYWMLVNVARLHPIAHLDQRSVFYRVHVGATSRTTRLGLPFLSSAAALRLGGGIIPPEAGVYDDTTGDLHRHLLLELVNDPRYRDRRFRRVVDALAIVLWPADGQSRLRRRATLAMRAPWLRGIRNRLRRKRA